MRCDKIIKIIEDWAPKSIAWEKDNVGLQVGSLRREVKNILLCLDVDEKFVDEANRKNCKLIISHHPLLFRSLKNLDVINDKKSRIIEKLIKKDITLYSAHTNLDFTKDGVSFQLAKKLKLSNQKFLGHKRLFQPVCQRGQQTPTQCLRRKRGHLRHVGTPRAQCPRLQKHVGGAARRCPGPVANQ